MQVVKCIHAALGECDKDAEVIYLGTAYCKEHAKEKIEKMQKVIEKSK